MGWDINDRVDKGQGSVSISNSEENNLQLYLLTIFVYMKALIKLGRTVDQKGFMGESTISLAPQVCNSFKKRGSF